MRLYFPGSRLTALAYPLDHSEESTIRTRHTGTVFRDGNVCSPSDEMIPHPRESRHRLQRRLVGYLIQVGLYAFVEERQPSPSRSPSPPEVCDGSSHFTGPHRILTTSEMLQWSHRSVPSSSCAWLFQTWLDHRRTTFYTEFNKTCLAFSV